MWMMGYNEPHEDHLNMTMLDSYTNNGTRKLRPLAPRPPPTSSSNRGFHSTPHDHLLHLNHHHHHHHLVEQNKREFNSQQMVVVSSRWNPTPEQLQTLEELYRRGTRTPSADEIQHITAQLRRFGKIEGKNVFYWFQNHKARERQKRRRQLDNKSSTHHDHIHQPTTFFSTDINHLDQPIQQKNLDVEETRNWAIPTFSEKNVLRERTGKSESMMTTAADHHTWIPVQQQQQEEEEEEARNDQNVLLFHRRRKNFPATWNHIIQSSSSSSSSSFPTNNHITTLFNSTCCTPFPTSKTTSSLVVSSHSNRHDELDESYETLELFPVNREQPEKYFSNPTSDHHVSSLGPVRQFIEFLPLKN